MRCSRRRPIPFSCSLALLLLGAARAPAQQPDEVLVGELARLLAAADARAFDPTLLRAALGNAQPGVRRQAALAKCRRGMTEPYSNQKSNRSPLMSSASPRSGAASRNAWKAAATAGAACPR